MKFYFIFISLALEWNASRLFLWNCIRTENPIFDDVHYFHNLAQFLLGGQLVARL